METASFGAWVRRRRRTLDLTQADRKGRSYDPSEWYVAPLSVIDQAIDRIISGDIVSYFYDREAQRLVSRASDHDG